MDTAELRLGEALILHAESGELGGRERREALELLSAGDRNRLADMSDARSDAFLTGRLLVRRGLVRLAAVREPAAVLQVACPHCGSSAHGRPSLLGVPVLVSIAYAGSVVFVALASADDCSALGVDAEARGAAADLTPAPHPALDPAADLERWTAIEAVLKADGRGLRVDPSEVSFEGRDLARVERAEASYRIHRALVDGRFHVAVATSPAPRGGR